MRALELENALLARVLSETRDEIVRLRRHLRTSPVPFQLTGAPFEMLWRAAVDDDDAVRFLRAQIERVAG